MSAATPACRGSGRYPEPRPTSVSAEKGRCPACGQPVYLRVYDGKLHSHFTPELRGAP